MSFVRLYETHTYEFLEGCDIRIVRNSSFEFLVTHEMTHHETKIKTKDGENKELLFIFALKKLFHKAV